MATTKAAHEMGGDVLEGGQIEIDESQLESGTDWTVKDFEPYARPGFKQQVKT
jgi:hypothetical protein